MKANELMIGDWVQVDTYIGKKKYKVTDLSNNDYGEYSPIQLFSDEGCVGVVEVEPIPLTGEILNANGYYNLSKDYYEPPFGDVEPEEWYDYGYNWVFEGEHLDLPNKAFYVGLTEIHKDEFIFSNLFGKCRFVHELQHALRICGLTELADNFKIEKL